MKKRLLLVDDEKVLSEALGSFFEMKGLKVSYAYDGDEAVKLYRKEMPDIILLDLDLPVKSGFEVAEIIRSEDNITPIIFMTGSYLDEESKIKGYRLGAIQFLDKPVLPNVLWVQIFNKLYPSVYEKKVTFGKNQYRLRNQTLYTPNQTIHLKVREALILSLLFEQPGELIHRKKILFHIWGHEDDRNDNTLDNLIYKLKQRIKPCSDLKITTSYSKGFILENNTNRDKIK